MKFKALFLVTIVAGCSEEPARPTTIENYSGIWVPYEIVNSDGATYHGPFTAMSIFGVYAESVQLKKDKTYIPVIWIDAGQYQFKTADAGNYTYAERESKLSFTDGVWDMNFAITHYDHNELWLTYIAEIPLFGGDQTLYKLKRTVEE